MNKRLHRVVFNAARGLRVVVQETARRAGGATVVVGLVAAAPAAGQIVGAPNVPGNLRPTVLVAPNGVPLVNIQTLSAAGVSRNVYSRFDVQRNGVILNNSRTAVQTQLGGFVQGNPWLARGPARIILNEINSGLPTQLRGYVEVGGQKAEVIIAKLTLYAGENQASAETHHATKKGMNHYSLDADSQDTTLARTTLTAKNIELKSRGDMTLGAIEANAERLGSTISSISVSTTTLRVIRTSAARKARPGTTRCRGAIGSSASLPATAAISNAWPAPTRTTCTAAPAPITKRSSRA